MKVRLTGGILTSGPDGPDFFCLDLTAPKTRAIVAATFGINGLADLSHRLSHTCSNL